MTTFAEAREMILTRVAPIGMERVVLNEASGRVLAGEIVAPWDMPACNNSAMDGYAVRCADCRGPVSLAVTSFLPAGGASGSPVEAGTAMKIMTGAPVPPGADAVVPFEETEEGDGWVKIAGPVKVGEHIRYRGEDVLEGDIVLTCGTVIRPPEISMLASLGKLFVPVFRRVRVAILSTGDELVEPGEPMATGKVINSNALALAAALREIGAEPLFLGIAQDTMECHREKIAEGLNADALITSAGVSAGDRDLVREVLAELGVENIFWRVEIKPGRPTAFGVMDGRPVFSLPGNPVSTMVTFEELVRPALLRMMGHRGVVKPFVTAELADEVRKKPGRVHFLRVRVVMEGGRLLARTAGNQNTGILKTMVQANGLAVLPAGKTLFPVGAMVNIHLLDRDFEMLER